MGNKAAIITMVKDECDIIELFVKINARVVDHIFVMDHDSKDDTIEILLRMKASGYPLTIYRNEAADFQQAIMITSLARKVAVSEAYDYIAVLDADEFIYCDQGRFADLMAQQIPPGSCGQMPWLTYVPTGGDYYTSSAPLYDVFRKRSREPAQFYKVVIPNEIAKVCVVGEGNHRVIANGQLVPLCTVTTAVQHLPVRSIEQLTAKALIGSHRMSIKVGRNKVLGMHWDLMAEKIRQENYRLTHSDMLAMAFSYTDGLNPQHEDLSVDETAPRVGTASDRLEFHELAQINLIKKFDQFIASLCAEVRPARGIPEHQ